MIEYTSSLAGITPDKLEGFFVGWPRKPTPERHLMILWQSYYRVLAVESESGKVVGFINAVSDGIMAAYIPLLEVLPEYQRQGIGGELVRRIMEKLGDLYMVDLACDENLQPFYERYGFRKYYGMMYRNFESQSC
jgi:ribosomal protein S18 acetylase RimI-like enzyme